MAKKKSIKEKPTKECGNISEALFMFQGESLTVARNGTGNISGRTYKYATLDDTLTAARPLLQKYKIMLTQIMNEGNLVTKLVHVPSMTEIAGMLPLGSPATSQDLGSRITYLRRYAITSMLGLVLEEDVDGTQSNGMKAGDPKSAAVMDTTGKAKHENTGTKTEPEWKEPKKEDATPESDAFKKAKTAIETCHSIEALDMLSARVKVSPNLTDDERKALEPVVEAKKAAIENPAK